MSEARNLLLVDAGNTSVKSCVVKANGETIRLGDPLRDRDLINTNKISRVLLVSVRAQSYSENLQQYCFDKQIRFREVTTSESAFGTACAYENYQTLGVDRWMMILAAAARPEDTILVMSIGTAMTLDLVHNKQHLGGWIAPGFDLAKSALFQKTANVFGNADYPNHNAFGDNTESCVNFGCRAQVNGLLKEGIKCAEEYSTKLKILVCGGGISLLDLSEFDDIEVNENLIFEGLMRFV
ncbi:type III pantothenate kinase [Planctobacterium marinum]|uniref:type III pantothenate kinase n=1 Tax=Planctobacterium marinum TaxID=1631968 RepID=UPI0030C690E9